MHILMVIVEGNRISDASSNPRGVCLHFTLFKCLLVTRHFMLIKRISDVKYYNTAFIHAIKKMTAISK